MMGLQGPSAWPDMMCLVASTFDEMIWPDEGGEDGELAATFFRHITLPKVSPTGNRPVPPWLAQGGKLYYSSGLLW